MVSSTVLIIPEQGSNLRDVGIPRAPVVGIPELAASSLKSLLRIPPFPGALLTQFAKCECSMSAADGIAERLRELRVGGTFWAAQPQLPDQYVLVRKAAALGKAKALCADLPIVLWLASDDIAAGDCDVPVIRGECDPWHVVGNASKLITAPGDELLLIAALLDVEIYLFDHRAGEAEQISIDARELVDRQLAHAAFENPFTGTEMSALDAIELCGFWRKLIDSNRDIGAGIGFAFWKQSHVAPLLWSGSGSFRFLRSAIGAPSAGSVALWRSKVPPRMATEIEKTGANLIEVEDGFIRSRGLGADCIPPLSITVDRLGAYFDPSKPSELESLLQDGEIDEPALERARELRRVIVETGLGKYGVSHSAFERPAGVRRHILVPGQVEDDRSVRTGGCGLVSNLELLRRVREQAPSAYVLYKPHPDVAAGHRRGAIPEAACLQFADQIVGNVPISSLIAMADEVHVNTSLAGFEALIRTKPVTTYGVPFYAGWGLTRDLGPVPSRRMRVRTLDELVAATLILYPRYLDPVTGLPCPAEVVVSRLNAAHDSEPALIVTVRRLQGKMMRHLRSLVQ